MLVRRSVKTAVDELTQKRLGRSHTCAGTHNERSGCAWCKYGWEGGAERSAEPKRCSVHRCGQQSVYNTLGPRLPCQVRVTRSPFHADVEVKHFVGRRRAQRKRVPRQVNTGTLNVQPLPGRHGLLQRRSQPDVKGDCVGRRVVLEHFDFHRACTHCRPVVDDNVYKVYAPPEQNGVEDAKTRYERERQGDRNHRKVCPPANLKPIQRHRRWQPAECPRRHSEHDGGGWHGNAPRRPDEKAQHNDVQQWITRRCNGCVKSQARVERPLTTRDAHDCNKEKRTCTEENQQSVAKYRVQAVRLVDGDVLVQARKAC
mmetsp:Transcript_11845/g.37625  ORF Transcript_11845/g.37625 Transcript_11845/m.37625 type:complete len:314 (+) Transcript_11845:643-1584(+)